jgi:hypothetical protein
MEGDREWIGYADARFSIDNGDKRLSVIAKGPSPSGGEALSEVEIPAPSLRPPQT